MRKASALNTADAFLRQMEIALSPLVRPVGTAGRYRAAVQVTTSAVTVTAIVVAVVENAHAAAVTARTSARQP